MNYIVLDTETANTFDDPICYDCGWVVIDDCGNVLATRSFVVADIFIYEKEMIKEAYFADKLPQYVADIADGKRTLKRFKNIKKQLRMDCIEYEVEAIMAHNMRFDYRSLTTTQRWLTKSKYRYFLPYGIEIYDTLKMARQTIAKQDDYIKFCEENDYLCANGTPRLTAEIIYRYLTQNKDFEESHTGLEDCLIEKDIFMKCMEINPNCEKRLWKD